MIIFDLINSILKCWFRFEFCCFNSVVHTKLIKILVRGCRDFRNKELWWKLDWYLIYHFSSFWEAQCFWVDKSQFFFNLFQLLMLLLHEIHQAFFWLFENLIRFIVIGLEFGLKPITRNEFSEVRAITSVLMCYNENFFGSICRFPLNYIKYSSGSSKIWSDLLNLA